MIQYLIRRHPLAYYLARAPTKKHEEKSDKSRDPIVFVLWVLIDKFRKGAPVS